MLTVTGLLAIIALPSILQALRGSLTIFEPITILSLVFLLYFAVSPLLYLVNDQTSYLGRDFRPVYLLGFVGVAISASFMWLGYSLPAGRRVGHWIASRLCPSALAGLEITQLAYMRKWGLALLVGGVAGLILSLLFGGGSLSSVLLPGVVTDESSAQPSDGTLNYLFLMMEWFIPAYLLLLAAGALRRRWLAIALAAPILAIYVSVGFRFRIVIFLVGVATVIFAGRSRRHVGALLVGGLILLAFMGYVGSARQFYRSGGMIGSPVPGRSDVVENSRSDTRIFETYAAVLSAVPKKVSYSGLDPLKSVFTLPIPRGFWEDKPTGEYLGKISDSIGTPASRFAGPAIPNFGEYYLALGWLGVAIGMILFGAAARALWEFWRASGRNPFALVIYACSLPFLLLAVIRGYSAQIVQEWFFIVFPAVVVAQRGRRRLRNQTELRSQQPIASQRALRT